MFNKNFLEELFQPQELYSKKALRTVFDRLAHASIMRLNAASMDKVFAKHFLSFKFIFLSIKVWLQLYDLMTMAFKYQVSLCLRPNDILLVTLNHMDNIREFVEKNAEAKNLVENVYRLLAQVCFGSTFAWHNAPHKITLLAKTRPRLWMRFSVLVALCEYVAWRVYACPTNASQLFPGYAHQSEFSFASISLWIISCL